VLDLGVGEPGEVGGDGAHGVEPVDAGGLLVLPLVEPAQALPGGGPVGGVAPTQLLHEPGHVLLDQPRVGALPGAFPDGLGPLRVLPVRLRVLIRTLRPLASV
jgi:hypothetical protein